jgi:Uma2 family endonuclease
MRYDPIRRHRLCVNDYYRMAETGILPLGARVELVDGEIVDMPPVDSRHAGTVDELAHLLRDVIEGEAIVRVQSPIRLDEHSEPQPDLALLRWRPDFYKSSHPLPSDVLLLVEVADTTLRYDRDIKVPLYARARVPEVWILDLERRAILRYRKPEGGEFGVTDEIDVSEPVTIGLLPAVRLNMRDIFS